MADGRSATCGASARCCTSTIANTGSSAWFEIVGVVEDVRNQGPTAPPEPEIFVPMEQQTAWIQLFLLIRTDADPRALLPLVRRELAAIDPAQPIHAVTTLEEAFADTVFPQRAAVILLLAYGMNGRDIPVPHGAPLRGRVERQMGYKSMKYLKRIVVTDEFDDGGKQGSIQNGWAWYTGI